MAGEVLNLRGTKVIVSKLVADTVEGAITADAGSVGTTELADGAVTAAKVRAAAAVTATADGLTTGIIPASTALLTVVTVTSGGATNAVTLPAATSDTIGTMLLLIVTSNGYELVTPASSNATINNVDADGTNQLDVAANTNLLCIQATASNWIAVQIANTTITVVAPDND